MQSRLNPIYRISDRIAAANPEIVHATQELLYFFFVVFLVDMHWFPGSIVSYIIGGTLMALALSRLLYFIVPYFLRRATRFLASDKKLQLIAAYRSSARSTMEMIIERELGLHSATRIVELLVKQPESKLRKSLMVNHA